MSNNKLSPLTVLGLLGMMSNLSQEERDFLDGKYDLKQEEESEEEENVED